MIQQGSVERKDTTQIHSRQSTKNTITAHFYTFSPSDNSDFLQPKLIATQISPFRKLLNSLKFTIQKKHCSVHKADREGYHSLCPHHIPILEG